MRFNRILTLVKTNLIFATQPAMLQNYRKKQAKNPSKPVNVAMRTLMQQLLFAVMFGALFGIPGAISGRSYPPLQFASTVFLFLMILISQALPAVYNVFYESKDFESYLPYAFTELEVVLGKSLSIVVATLQGFLPIVMLFGIHVYFSRGNFLLTIPIALIGALVLNATVYVLMFLLCFFLAKIPLFRKYQSVIANVLIFGISLGAVIGYQMILSKSVVNTVLTGEMPLFLKPVLAFYDAILNPLDLSVYPMMGLVLLVFVAILLLVKFIVLPNFYQAVSQTSSSKVKVERVKQMELDGSKISTKFMIRYTLRQLMEGSVLTQTIISAGILPYLLLLPTVFNLRNAPAGINFMDFLNLNTFLPFAMLITFIAFFNTGGNNLLAVGISLERENYYYLKVLPFDMHEFLERKFWILFAIQSAIPVILMTVICTVLRLPIYMTLGIILSWGIISLGLSRWGYARDLKLFTPSWTNVIELLNRTRSGVKSIIFVVVLFGFIFGAIYLLIHLPEWNRTFVWIITIAYVVLILGLSIFATFHYKKKLHELVDSE
ncbi:hypothetical protein HMPREF3103_01475 [Granulicatella sp. HMSC30F09]|uniref:hypothetical protein n=1 Tax=Granulicatella sp. HMSC30F09 TaxID=1581071 RepID=UPI0008A4A0AD|nr:hypothetical protein [Granulicatella sp. HMSC30F09]OFT81308.1 hypothetical protein HMPREF3103_01475 [Granulicatella sp. HMSC30F09]